MKTDIYYCAGKSSSVILCIGNDIPPEMYSQLKNGIIFGDGEMKEIHGVYQRTFIIFKQYEDKLREILKKFGYDWRCYDYDSPTKKYISDRIKKYIR